MIVPNRLEEVLIAVPNELYDKAVSSLASEGIFHVADLPDELKEFQIRGYRKLSVDAMERRSRLEGFFKALGLAPETSSGVTIEVKDWESAFEKIVEENRNVEDYFSKVSERITELAARMAELAELRSLVAPVSFVEADLTKAAGGVSIRGFLGLIPKEAAGKAASVVEHYGGVAASADVDETTSALAFAVEPDAARAVISELSRMGWRQVSLPPDMPGSPSEASKLIEKALTDVQEELGALRAEALKRLDDLKQYYTQVYAMSEVFKVLNNTARTSTTSFIHGFIDVRESARLRRILDSCCGGSYVVISLGRVRGGREVPTKVDLPGYFKWFDSIVKMYGTPNSDEIVPTIFMAVTMPIIFGLMFPDIGHGLLVILFAALYMLPRSRDIAKVAMVLGAAGMVTGFLAGEFFGPIPAKAIGLDAFWKGLPPLLSPVDAAMSASTSQYTIDLFDLILDISFWIGAFMLVFGNVLGVANDVISRDLEDLVARRLPFTLLFTSVGLPFLVYFSAFKAGGVIERALFDLGRGGPMEAVVFYGALAAIVWLMIGEGIYSAMEGEGFKVNPYEAFLGFFEGALLVIGNTISFLRIMGLSLAHAGLMVGFTVLYYTVLAGMHYSPAGWVAAIVVYIFGNLLTAGLEGIVAFAHDLRLHFYEWFNKFYHGLGVPFNPIGVAGVRFVVL